MVILPPGGHLPHRWCLRWCQTPDAVTRLGPQDGVLAPAPQYPLYSATTTLFDGTLGSYYLDEAADWAAPVQELKKAYDDVVEKGATPKLLVIINPGEPDGHRDYLEPPRSHRALRGKAAD